MTAEEMATCDSPEMITMNMYLSQIYHIFRGEIPAIKHKKIVSINKGYTKSLILLFLFL